MNKNFFVFILSLSLFPFSSVLASLPEKGKPPILSNLPSPIGDNVHSDVYFFIKDILLKEPTLSLEARQRRLDQEIVIHQNKTGDKPLMAEVAEGELAHLLTLLCQQFSWCHEITLYQRNGVAVATSSPQKDIIFEAERDLSVRLGFLTPDLMKDLGQKKRLTTQGRTYVDVTQAIYCQKDNAYAYLSNTHTKTDDSLIGFVSYLVDERTFKTVSALATS